MGPYGVRCGAQVSTPCKSVEVTLVAIDGEQPLLLRTEEVAELLSISRSKVYQLIRQGRLPSVRLTGSVRVPRAALHELVQSETGWPGQPQP